MVLWALLLWLAKKREQKTKGARLESVVHFVHTSKNSVKNKKKTLSSTTGSINNLIPISEPPCSYHLKSCFSPPLTNSHCNYTENSMPFCLASPWCLISWSHQSVMTCIRAVICSSPKYQGLQYPTVAKNLSFPTPLHSRTPCRKKKRM